MNAAGPASFHRPSCPSAFHHRSTGSRYPFLQHVARARADELGVGCSTGLSAGIADRHGHLPRSSDSPLKHGPRFLYVRLPCGLLVRAAHVASACELRDRKFVSLDRLPRPIDGGRTPRAARAALPELAARELCLLRMFSYFARAACACQRVPQSVSAMTFSPPQT